MTRCWRRWWPSRTRRRAVKVRLCRHGMLLPRADLAWRFAVLMAHTWRKPEAEGAFFARLTGAEGGFRCADVTPAEGAAGDPPRPHGTRLLRLWRPQPGEDEDAVV